MHNCNHQTLLYPKKSLEICSHDKCFIGFAAFSESPSPSPSQSDEDDDASDADDNKKLLKNPTNQAPTKSRPEFKKYAVKDFRFLRVLGKGR